MVLKLLGEVKQFNPVPYVRFLAICRPPTVRANHKGGALTIFVFQMRKLIWRDCIQVYSASE